MLVKEQVLEVIENIIKEPVRRDGGLPKEIQILKAVEDMDDWHDDGVILCRHCFYYRLDEDNQSGICHYHQGACYPDDYCSFGIKKE